MKKAIAILCALVLCLSMAACGDTTTQSSSGSQQSSSSQSSGSGSQSSGAQQSSGSQQSSGEAAALDYPTKNINLIIPYAAGGDADNMFRCLESSMSQFLNGNVIVGEIVSGGNAIPGTQQSLDAAKDGYNIVIAYPGNICIQPNMGNATYSFDDFQAISCISASPVLFAVQEDAPYDDFNGWIEWVKAHPGEFTFCTGSLGGTPHLAMMKMLYALGIQDDVVYVPYSGNAEAYAAVAGGQIGGFAAVASGVIGKEFVKPILNLGSVEVPAAPDLDTLADGGVDMSQATDVFCGFACSSQVDKEIVKYLSDAFAQAMELPEVQENFANLNYTTNYLDADAFQKYLDENYEAYAMVIENLDLAQ